jgi:hypothetical protein
MAVPAYSEITRHTFLPLDVYIICTLIIYGPYHQSLSNIRLSYLSYLNQLFAKQFQRCFK